MAHQEPAAGVTVLPEPAHPVSRQLEDTVDAQPCSLLCKRIMHRSSRWPLCAQFSTLLRHDIVKDLVCFYSEERRRFSCIMQLGE